MGAGMSETHAICPEMDRYTVYTIHNVLKLKFSIFYSNHFHRERLLLITEEYGVTKVQFATIIQCKEVEANEVFSNNITVKIVI